MTRYIFRGCPRCGGDLYLNEQHDAPDDWQCLQCGRYRSRRRQPAPAQVSDFWAYWQAQAAAAQPERLREGAN